MQQLEQQCWKFLITIINSINCDHLHDLADKYDCPPLKLASFRILQENDPTYKVEPIDWNVTKGRKDFINGLAWKNGSGLTGPGESSFYTNAGILADHIFEEEDEDDYVPSIIGFTKNKKKVSSNTRTDRHHQNDKDSNNNEENDSQQSNDNTSVDSYAKYTIDVSKSVSPYELPPNATAREVVKAWAHRLQFIYLQCMPTEHELEIIDEITNTDDETEDENNYGNNHLNNNNKNGKNINNQQNLIFNYKRTDLNQSNNPINRLKYDTNYSIDWKQELKRFYSVLKMPEKLTTIDEILVTWEGKEEQMLSALMVKYQKLLPQTLFEHFQDILNKIETQTESSFIHQNQSPSLGHDRDREPTRKELRGI